MPPDELLRGDALVKRYRGRPAVDRVDLSLVAGQVHGLLGANGAGKSTLLRLLLGLTEPDAGHLTVLGRQGGGGPDVAGFTGSPRFWPGLSARRTLRLLSDLDAGRGRDRITDVLGMVDLAGHADARVDAFSTGMRQRLALAAALLRAPRVLLLDEPATGLDPVGIRDLQLLLRTLAAAGTAVLLSSNDLAGVSEVCDSVTVLREGRTAWSGSMPSAATAVPVSVLRTSDDARALEIARSIAGLTVDRHGDRLTVTGHQRELDALVLQLSGARVVVRLLAPERHPWEAVFFASAGDRP